MTATPGSRYQYSSAHSDSQGRIFLDVPEPLDTRSRLDDAFFTVSDGQDLFAATWAFYKALLDPRSTVHPSNLFWVVCQYNGIDDPINNPPTPGTQLRAPSIQTLINVHLSGPRFRG